MQISAISSSELEVMKFLWKNPGAALPEIIEGVQENNEWEKSTVKTLLARLVEKSLVEQQGRKRLYTYHPLVTLDEFRNEATENLVQQAFNNNIAEIVSFFVRSGKLSPEDITELEKNLLELKK